MERSDRGRARCLALWCVAAAVAMLCSCESGRSQAPAAAAAETIGSPAAAGAVAQPTRPAVPLSDEDSSAEANSFLADRLTGGRHYFLQISDTHIGGGAEAQGEKQLFPTVHPSEKLRHALKIISAFDPKPDFLLITGDLTDHCLAAEYESFKRVLAEEWTGPVAVMRGNHDSDLATFLDEFGYLPYAEPQRMTNTGFCYAFDYEGIRMVCLDSEKYGSALPESEWLAGELEAARDRAVLVANHRHLFGTRNRLVDSVKGGLPQPEAEAMARQLRGASHLAGLLCGHIHYTSVREQDGIRQFTLTSTFYAIESLGSAEGGLFARLVHIDGGEMKWAAIKDLRGTTRLEWPVVEHQGGDEGAAARENVQ